MTVFVSFLRGINVSGQKKVPMEKLKKVFESLSLKDVTTYIQSGNVVCQSKEFDSQKMKQLIEKAILDEFGFEVPVVLRTKEELTTILAKNPFAKKEAEHIYIILLNEPTAQRTSEKANKCASRGEEYTILGTVVYLYLQSGYGRTKLNNTFFEKELGVVATTRNLRTMKTMVELAENILAQ